MSDDAEGVNSASYLLIYLMHTPIIIIHPPINNMTAFQYNHSFGFQKPMKVKVVKWGWTKWNEHDLMHIYHKQCEIIQKIEWNSSNGQIHCFHYVR